MIDKDGDYIFTPTVSTREELQKHEPFWKEIEAIYIELAQCICSETEVNMPCLHHDSDAFKVWYQMEFDREAFTDVYDSEDSRSYYDPLERLECFSLIRGSAFNLPHTLIYNEKKGWDSRRGSKYFSKVKESVLYWRESRK